MTIKNLHCIYLDELSFVQLEKEPSARASAGLWLSLEGLRVLRDKINIILGEETKNSPPDPNLLIDYFKEQAAEEPCCEYRQIVEDFVKWKERHPYVVTIDQPGGYVIYMGVRNDTRPKTKNCPTLMEAMKEAVRLKAFRLKVS